MTTFLFVSIPMAIGYWKIAEKVIVPVIEGVVEGTKDGIRDLKKMKQDKETKK